jgi:hypothetical protein
MEIFTGLLMAIDRAITLVQTQNTQRQAMFKEIVEPIFSETERSIANYNVIIGKVIAALSQHASDLRPVIREFARDRIELNAVRVKLTALIVVYFGLPMKRDFAYFQLAHLVNDGLEFGALERVFPLMHKDHRQLAPFLAYCYLSILVSPQGTMSREILDLLEGKTAGLLTLTKAHEMDDRDRLREVLLHLQRGSQKYWELACTEYAKLKLTLALPK